MEKVKKLFTIRNIIIAIIAIMIIMAGIATILLLNQNDGGAKKTRTSISGLPTDIPSDTSALIQAGLYDAISLNLPQNETPPKSGATIRSGTLETGFNERTNIHYGDFITDIESVQQSFSVHYEWTDDKNNSHMTGYPVMITCVEKSERIYDTTYCADAYHQINKVIDDFANSYLPYRAKTKNGIDYNIIKDYVDTKPVIAIISYTCKDTAEALEVEESAESWLESKENNIDSSDIIYKNYCNGMIDTFPALKKRTTKK